MQMTVYTSTELSSNSSNIFPSFCTSTELPSNVSNMFPIFYQHFALVHNCLPMFPVFFPTFCTFLVQSCLQIDKSIASQTITIRMSCTESVPQYIHFANMFRFCPSIFHSGSRNTNCNTMQYQLQLQYHPIPFHWRSVTLVCRTVIFIPHQHIGAHLYFKILCVLGI